MRFGIRIRPPALSSSTRTAEGQGPIAKARRRQIKKEVTPTDEADPMISTPMAITLITLQMATWWVLHKLAHVIVTEYGITGGLVACGALYASSLVMDRYGL
ncbi:MAG: hypothetical protein JWO19_5942 [Bryobacterales bacterium]|nr:hypothetical protein [Bryobacterales bacterium]